MEFHNVKLLPKGLPEIMAQFVPYESYLNTKVIAHSKRDRRGIAGMCHTEDLPFRCVIHLYPTVNAFHSSGIGVFSFVLWRTLLETSLHEIGHLATGGIRDINQETYDKDAIKHQYIESLADKWRDRAMVKIATIDDRLGQPTGGLTGYPGILAYRMRGRMNGDFHPARLAEWRALKCDAQIPISAILRKLCDKRGNGGLASQRDIFFDNMWEVDPPEEKPGQMEKKNEQAIREYRVLEKVLRRNIHRAAHDLGITRHSLSKTGRRYLMFNLGEAEAVYSRCLDMDTRIPQTIFYEWQKIDGFWEIIEVDKKTRIPKEQMRFKIKA